MLTMKLQNLLLAFLKSWEWMLVWLTLRQSNIPRLFLFLQKCWKMILKIWRCFSEEVLLIWEIRTSISPKLTSRNYYLLIRRILMPNKSLLKLHMLGKLLQKKKRRSLEVCLQKALVFMKTRSQAKRSPSQWMLKIHHHHHLSKILNRASNHHQIKKSLWLKTHLRQAKNVNKIISNVNKSQTSNMLRKVPKWTNICRPIPNPNVQEVKWKTEYITNWTENDLNSLLFFLFCLWMKSIW